MKMSLPIKEILINNFSHVNEYLKIDAHAELQLDSLKLDQNRKVPGVSKLLALIPDGYNPKAIRRFYLETGLRIQMEVYQSNFELVRYDKDGRYPREDAAIWNKEFMDRLAEHPEWLEPQEEPDILIRYLFQPEEEDRVTNNFIFVM